MVEMPARTRHGAEFALLAGFILLLLFEAFFVPAGERRTARHAGMPRDAPALSRVAQEAPTLPTPAP